MAYYGQGTTDSMGKTVEHYIENYGQFISKLSFSLCKNTHDADYRSDYFAVIDASCGKIAEKISYNGAIAYLSDEALTELLGSKSYEEYILMYENMMDRQYK